MAKRSERVFASDLPPRVAANIKEFSEFIVQAPQLRVEGLETLLDFVFFEGAVHCLNQMRVANREGHLGRALSRGPSFSISTDRLTMTKTGTPRTCDCGKAAEYFFRCTKCGHEGCPSCTLTYQGQPCPECENA